MLTLLASFWTKPVLGVLRVWQIPVIIALVALIIFWKSYRNKQM